ncbi:MAG: Rap1a/Tai family immunity protein [Gammaproteobacteria bacterium]|nr:Rap1a/Tai family immunity protein [Gammaproteobacteria bacterium]
MFNICFKEISVKWLSSIILAATIISIPAFAIDSKMQMTGDVFSNACTRADESWVSFCNGYIQAVIDSIPEEDSVCLPKGTTRTDVVTITEKEITASKQLQEMNAHEAVRLVLHRFYPCQ